MNDPPTGNQAHQAPELRNIFGTFVRGTDIVVDYSGQAVFEVGVLLCEVLTLRHPITGYAAAGRHLEYSRSNCCEFPPSIKAQLREEGYSDGFLALIRSMVAYDPARRPALKAARAELIKLLSSPEETHTAVRRPMDTSPVLPPPTRWTCIACNGVNSGDSTRCASCSIDRSAPAITPWHCRSCSFRNTFYVRMCGKCGASAAEETGLDGRPLPAYAVTTRAPLTVTTRSPATPVMTSSITPGWRCACGCATNESFRRTCKQCFAGKV